MTEENKTDNGHPIHPFDMKPTIELTVPLTVDLFVYPPKDVLNTRLHDIIGNKFVAKKGQTEREREASI